MPSPAGLRSGLYSPVNDLHTLSRLVRKEKSMNQNGRRRSSIEFDTFAGKKVCQVLFELVLMSFRGFLFQKVFNWNALSLQISQETTTIEVAYFGNLVRGVG